MKNQVISRNGLLANYIGVAVSVMVAWVAGCRGGDEVRRHSGNVPFPFHLTPSVNPFLNEKNSGEESADFAPPNIIRWASADEPGIFLNPRNPFIFSTPREPTRRTNKRLHRSFVPWKWSWRKKPSSKEINRMKSQESILNATVPPVADKSSKKNIFEPLTSRSLKTKVTSTSTQSSSVGTPKIPSGLESVIEKLKPVSSTKTQKEPPLTSTHSISTTNHEDCPFYGNKSRNVSSLYVKKKDSVSSTSTSGPTRKTNPGGNNTGGLGKGTISSTSERVSVSGNRSTEQSTRLPIEDGRSQITMASLSHLTRKRKKQLRKKIVHLLHRKAPWMFAQKSIVLSKNIKGKDGVGKESTSMRTEKGKIENDTKTV